MNQQNKPNLSQLDLAQDRAFWANTYCTGGRELRLDVMAMLKEESKNEQVEYDLIGPLDATELIPIGGTGWMKHTLLREF